MGIRNKITGEIYSITTYDSSNGNITGINIANGNTDLGDVTTVFIGGGAPGEVLSTDGSGNLTWIDNSTGSPNSIVSGTTTVDIPVADGDVVVTVGGTDTWTFGSGNLLTLPGGAIVDSSDDNFEVRGVENVNFEAASDINLSTDGGGNSWTFGQDGNLTLADGGFLVVSGGIVGGGASPAPYLSGFSSLATVGTQGNITASGNLNAVGNMIAGGNASASHFIGNGAPLASLTGANVTGTVANAVFATLAATANAVAGANVTGQVANALVAGTVYEAAQPNITSVGTLTALDVTGNVSGNVALFNEVNINNLSTNAMLYTDAARNVTNTDFSYDPATNTIAGGNLTLTGNATADYFIGNGSSLTSLTGANVTGEVALANTVSNPLQPNITSVGVLTSLTTGGLTIEGLLTANGNAQFNADVYFAGNVTLPGTINQISGNSATFFGDPVTGFGALYVGLISGYTLLDNEVAQFADNFNGYTQVTHRNINGGDQATGDFVITADNGTDTTNYIDMGMAGSGYDGAMANNSLGTVLYPNDGYLYAQGDVTGGNLVLGSNQTGGVVRIIANGASALADTVATFAATGLTVANAVTAAHFIGEAGNLSNITAGNITGTVASATVAASANSVAGANVSGQVANSLVAATVYEAAQPNITSVGTLTSLAVSGNITAGNISGGNLVTANFLTGTLTTAAQPNITSVGTLVDLSVTGNVTANNYSGNTATYNLSVTAPTFVGNLSTVASPNAETIVVGALPVISPPTPGEFNGTTRTVTTEAELTAAITASVAGDIIVVSGTITVTATVAINKRLKFTGTGTIRTAGAGSDPVTVLNITADGVWLDDNLTITHSKTTNTSVETAVTVNALNFVSGAEVNFVEFGYILRGSFTITGVVTQYVGALGNNHRHISIFKLSAPSEISNVQYDFPVEATPRASFIYVSSSSASDTFDSTLIVKNTSQVDPTNRQRQFYLQDTLVGTGGSLIFYNNQFNDLNGGIGFISSTIAPLDFINPLTIVNNTQGNAAAGNYKGMVFFDGTNATPLRSYGNGIVYSLNNVTTAGALRADYTAVLDTNTIAVKSATYDASVKIIPQNSNSYNTAIDFLYEFVGDNTYGNSNVSTYLASNTDVVITTVGNITTTANISGAFIKGNGSELTNITAANVVGTVASATVSASANSVAGANVSGEVAFAAVANSVAVANVSGIGNIAVLNIDGDSANILYGNGVFAALPTTPVGGSNTQIQFNDDGNLGASANLTFIDTVVGGTIGVGDNLSLLGNGTVTTPIGNLYLQPAGNLVVTAGASDWVFDTTGNLTTPSNLVIGPGPGSGSSIFQYNEGLQILGEGANSVVQMGWTANTSAPDSVTTIAMNYPGGGEGNVLIAVGNNATTVNYWLFDNTGNLRLPGNTFAVNYANGDQVTFGGDTGNVTFDDVTIQGVYQLNLSAGPEYTANLAYLQVRAGDFPSHIHFDTGDSEIYDLYIGNDQKFVQVSSTGNIIMSSFDSANSVSYAMTLDTTGDLTIPGNIQSIAAGGFNSAITDIELGSTVIVIIADLIFGGPETGQVTISDVVGTIEANGIWYFQATDTDRFELFTDDTLSTPVDGTTWTAYVSGGTAVSAGNYTNLTVQGGNVTVAADLVTWSFDNTGNLTLPGNTFAVNYANGDPVTFASAPSVGTVTSGATITPTGSSTQYNVTALAESATFAAPSGTPADGQKLTIRILDNGTPQTLAWNAVYEVIGTTLPTTTVASKYTYVGCIYNAQSSKWDVVSVASQV